MRTLRDTPLMTPYERAMIEQRLGRSQHQFDHDLMVAFGLTRQEVDRKKQTFLSLSLDEIVAGRDQLAMEIARFRLGLRAAL